MLLILASDRKFKDYGMFMWNFLCHTKAAPLRITFFCSVPIFSVLLQLECQTKLCCVFLGCDINASHIQPFPTKIYQNSLSVVRCLVAWMFIVLVTIIIIILLLFQKPIKFPFYNKAHSSTDLLAICVPIRTTLSAHV